MFENLIMQTEVFDVVTSFVAILTTISLIGIVVIGFILKRFRHKLSATQVQFLENARDTLMSVYKDRVKIHNTADILYSSMPEQARRITNAHSVKLSTLRADVDEAYQKILKLNSILGDPSIPLEPITEVNPMRDITHKWEETTGEIIKQ